MTSLSTLRANETAITELPSSIVRLKNLRCLSLLHWSSSRGFKRITFKSLVSTPNFRNLNLPPSVQGLSSLVDLSINGCIITNVPKDLGSLSSLESLDIRRCYLQSLPSFSGLSQLVYLRLLDCNLTDELIKVMDLGSLSSLKLLRLDDNSFSSLPSLRSLSKLVNLSLRSCTNLVAIPDLPTSLKNLCASDCTALEIMPDFSDMSNMRRMFLNRCAKLVEVPGLDESMKSSMRLLVMEGCIKITATFKEKILQGCNFIGPGGIYFPRSDIPKWLTWATDGAAVNFQVPQISNCNVIALTPCFTLLDNGVDQGRLFPDTLGLWVTNHTKRTSFFNHSENYYLNF